MITSTQQLTKEIEKHRAAGKSNEEAVSLAYDKLHPQPTPTALTMKDVVRKLMRDDGMSLDDATSKAYRLFAGAEAARIIRAKTGDVTAIAQAATAAGDVTGGYGSATAPGADKVPPMKVFGKGKPKIKLNSDMSYTIEIPPGIDEATLAELNAMLEGFE